MNNKRLLNYQFLRDQIMCMEQLDKQTAQQIKSILLKACYDLSYIKFVDARFYMNTMGGGINTTGGGDKVIIIFDLMSEKHSTQVHFEVSANSHCCNATIKRKFSIFEGNRKNGTWEPVGKAELNDEAGELLSLIIKNLPGEFILHETAEDLPVIHTPEPNTNGHPPVVQPEHLLRLKEEMDASINNKIGEAAEKTQKWIIEWLCPLIQEWLEKALGRKLDVKIGDVEEPEGGPEMSPDDENKSNLI